MTWLDTPAHARWLEAEGDRLLEFGRAYRHPGGGFAWLTEEGTPDLERPVEIEVGVEELVIGHHRELTANRT